MEPTPLPPQPFSELADRDVAQNYLGIFGLLMNGNEHQAISVAELCGRRWGPRLMCSVMDHARADVLELRTLPTVDHDELQDVRPQFRGKGTRINFPD